MPVIAYSGGGARDSVIDGETGLFCEAQTVASLCDAILRFEDRTFDEATVRDNARRFGPERFRAEVGELLDEQARLRAEA